MMPFYRQETESSNIYQSRFGLKNSVLIYKQRNKSDTSARNEIWSNMKIESIGMKIFPKTVSCKEY